MCLPALAVVGSALGASTAASAATVGTLATLSAAGGALGAYGAYQQGQAAKAAGRTNQIMGEYAAQDAIRRGEENATKIQQQARALKGSQRASMAAKGLDLGVGTSAELQDQTDFFGAVDASTARFNAQRDAWSSRAGGANARAQGDAAARQGNLQAFGTLLTTGGQVASKWYTNKG